MNSKKIISIIQLIFVFWISISCKIVENQIKLDSYIKQITMQEWIGGHEQTGLGINFHIYLNKSLPKNYKLLEVQYKGSIEPIEKINDLEFIARFKNPIKEQTSKIKLKENQIKVIFLQGKRKKEAYFLAKKLDLLAYPSPPPRNGKE